MKNKRERYIVLLPQTHSPEVDYSFIMETVEMVLEKKETTPAGLRRSFPPPICCLLASISGFSRVRLLFPKNVGGPLYKGFLGQDGVVEKKIDGSGATRPHLVGPTRPGTGAAWATPFGPPASVCLIPSLRSLPPSKILTPVFLQVI